MNRRVCVFGGRFQPIHPGHYAMFKKTKEIMDKHGFEYYFAVSKTYDGLGSNPLSFDQKLKLISLIYPDLLPFVFEPQGSPLFPKNLLSTLEPETTSYVLIRSSKDDNFHGKNLLKFVEQNDYLPMKEKMYWLNAEFSPMLIDLAGENLVFSGSSDLREYFKTLKDPKKFNRLIRCIYGQIPDEAHEILSSVWYKCRE